MIVYSLLLNHVLYLLSTKLCEQIPLWLSFHLYQHRRDSYISFGWFLSDFLLYVIRSCWIYYVLFVQEEQYNICHIKYDLMFQSREAQCLKFHNILYELELNMEPAVKTIWMFKDFDEKDEDSVKSLSNLIAIGARILDPEIKVTMIRDDSDEENIKYYHSVSLEDFKQNPNNKVTTFDIVDGDVNHRVHIFDTIVDKQAKSELAGQTIRVVTLPFEKKIINVSQIAVMLDQIQAMHVKSHNESKQNKLQGETLRAHEENSKRQIKEKQEEFTRIEDKNHTKVFRIENLLYILHLKSEYTTVCTLMEAKKKEKISEAINHLKAFFHLPEGLSPKVVLHLANPNAPHEDINHADVLSVFAYKRKEKQFYLDRGTREQIFSNLSNFTQNKELRTKLYELRNCKNENKYLASATEAFVNEWNGIVEASVTCIAPVIKRVFGYINMDDSNTSLVESENNIQADSSREIPKDVIPVYRFEQIFSKFGGLKGIFLKESEKLQKFYTQKRLGKTIRLENGESIPQSIQGLAFLHFFYNVNNEFLAKFSEYEKKDYSEFLKYIFSHIKLLSELVATINDTLLRQEAMATTRCEDLEKYVNFIQFLLHSTVNIKNITVKQLKVTGQIRVFFEQLKPKDNRILSFIIKNEDNIKANEGVAYYDIYLKIIKESCGNEGEGKIESITTMIHKYKADRIAAKYSWDRKFVVEAIKSYSEILLTYDRLSEAKKAKFNKFKISKKIADLLCLIDQAEEAANIFKNNRLMVHLDKCAKAMIMQLSPESAAKKLIEFGEFFATEFEYGLALDYFRKAYDIADTTETRRLAIEKKFWCIDLKKDPRTAERLPYTKFVDKGSEDDFVSGGENKEQSQEQYRRLKKRLQWDEQAGVSSILEHDEEDFP